VRESASGPRSTLRGNKAEPATVADEKSLFVAFTDDDLEKIVPLVGGSEDVEATSRDVQYNSPRIQ